MDEEDDEVPEAVPLLNTQVNQTQGHSSETDQKNEEKRQPWRPVPVTLISGFLGAGKTTLVNYVLSAKHGYRVAVVLNEFGESAGIEKALLNDSKGEDAFELQDWVELSNGCLCCSVKNEFVQALEALMTKRDKFDYILIECSGLADPGPVATALWTDAELESGVCLDAIVTVVDANNIQRQVSSKRESGAINEAQTQIAYADVVLLNKVDTIPDEGALNAIESLITSINGRASIIRTNRCQLDLGQILDRGSFDPGQASRHADDLSNAMGKVQGSGDIGGHTQGEQRPPGQQLTQAHHHDAGIRTVSITLPGYVQLDKLRHWLDFLLWERPSHKEDILRLKGLVNLADGAGRRVIQAVHEVYDIFAARPLQQGESQLNQIVLIGRHLDEEYLTNSFRQCLAVQEDDVKSCKDVNEYM